MTLPNNEETPRVKRVKPPVEAITKEDITKKKKEIRVYKKGKCLGKGSHGDVFKALNTETGEIFAIKELRSSAPKNMSKFKKEARFMQTLHHPNIVKSFGVKLVGSKLHMLMEYVQDNDLRTYIKEFGPLSEYTVASYIRQILLGLEFCHSNNIIHRDLKGRNILVSDGKTVKIADFGSAIYVKDVITDRQSQLEWQGTALWAAPEVCVSGGVYNSKVDIWSLGCVIVELISGRDPWKEHNFENPFQAMLWIGSHDQHPQIKPLKKISASLYHFIKQCFIRDPDARPSAKELLQHPLINKYRNPPPIQKVKLSSKNNILSLLPKTVLLGS